MSRTRVHNLMVSLDGYAAGEYVTAEEPIGGAGRLFQWFDGRVIDGIDRIADPVTFDRAMISMWGQGIGAEIMGRRKFHVGSGPLPDDWEGFPQRKDYPLGGVPVEYKGAEIPPPDQRRVYQ